ncbi:MAG: hypothetical protein V4671_05765 [Armatimonadota bacterium]
MKLYNPPAILACFALLLVTAIKTVEAQDPAPRYKLTDLGAISGFPNSRAYGINNKGQVVGQVAKLEPKIDAHAVLWEDGKVRDITGPKGLLYTVANSINDLGQAAGGSEIKNYGSVGINFMGLSDQAFLWTKGKTTTLSPNRSHAYAVNNKGQAAGTADGLSAVVWESGNPVKLPTPADTSSSIAYGINSKGQSVGSVIVNRGKPQAVLWTEGKMVLLGTLFDDDQGIACAVNDRGQVVGSTGQSGSSTNTPFLWENGQIKVLNPLEGGTRLNQALGINNRGVVVGCGMKSGVYQRAVVWDGGETHDLNDLIAPGLGLVLAKATAINDRGQIVGEALDDKMRAHAFLLTPVSPAGSK